MFGLTGKVFPLAGSICRKGVGGKLRGNFPINTLWLVIPQFLSGGISITIFSACAWY